MVGLAVCVAEMGLDLVRLDARFLWKSGLRGCNEWWRACTDLSG